MMETRSSDALAAQYEDPDTLNRKPPPAVTYKKEGEAATVQPNTTPVSGRGRERGCSWGSSGTMGV